MRRFSLVLVFFCALAMAQEVKPRPEQQPTVPPTATAATNAPNSNAVYQKLRHARLSGDAVTLNGYTLTRDAGVFTLSGTVSFLEPVEGKVTGAVFSGQGTFTLTPPIAVEKRNLAILTKEEKITEDFSDLVLRFTDNTYDELKKAGASAAAGSDGALTDVNNYLRTKVRYNLHARLLMDVLNPQAPGMFAAFIKGKKYSSHWMFVVDPQASTLSASMAPEEVLLSIPDWNESNFGMWASFHLSDEYASGKANAPHLRVIDIEDQNIDATIEKSARLSGVVETKFKSNVDGLRVVSFDLFRRLRVSSVVDASGAPLEFIQEDRDEDADFAVILAKPLAAGQEFTIKTTYAGPDAIRNEGGGNYYPVARDNWYPSAGGFEDFALYHVRLSVPKGLTVVATGTRLSEENVGSQNVTEWQSEAPQTVAGFQFGKFKKQEKTLKDGIVIQGFANSDVPDMIKSLQRGVEEEQSAGVGPHQPGGGPQGAPEQMVGANFGNMTTTGMITKAMAEAEASSHLYMDYFGDIGMKRIAMTQQTATNYGQAWPQMIFLPMTSFYDSTIRAQLGMSAAAGYFKVVAPHEVAHQWWGHAVSWKSYRDQWMSEGFSDFSASLFLQKIFGQGEYLKFWEDEHKMLVLKNKFGYRPNDIGPVTLGYRLDNPKSGAGATRALIYAKGAFILHMLRFMMWSNQSGDQPFKDMMHDFVATYQGKPASTEDFKAIVEKHMSQDMNLDGNGKLDWFFNEYVYGTQLPDYSLKYTIGQDASGPNITVDVKQANVDPNFKARVALYLELANGKIVRLGTSPMTGNTQFNQTISLSSLRDKPKRAILNYNYDVLGTIDGQ